jgi:hypothetical protein
MESKWLNDGEPDDNGDYTAIIVDGEGQRTSTFKGKSYKEVADKLLTSQVMANRRLMGLKKPDQAKPPLKVEPKQLSPDDRFRLATSITDPSKVVEAVTEIVTAQQGISPDKIGQEFNRLSQEEQDRIIGEEARAFTREHPAYYPVAQNRDALFDELKANGWDLTRNNLAIAYQTLMDREDLIPWPEGEAPQPNGNPGNGSGQPSNGHTGAQPAQPVPITRPRSIATGIRNSDASAQPVSQPTKKQFTRADIERMSRVEYTQRLQTDPDFRRQVDAMGA